MIARPMRSPSASPHCGADGSRGGRADVGRLPAAEAGHHIGADFETALDSLGLSGRELLVLGFVRRADGLSQQALSERLGLDPTLVVGLVGALEQRALVRRTKDP